MENTEARGSKVSQPAPGLPNHRAVARRRQYTSAGAGVQPRGGRRVIEDSYRLFYCARCGRPRDICPRCDRGQIYCCRSCSKQSRREKQGESGQRYQRSLRGRLRHAARQQRYRKRQRSTKEVTHQGSPPKCEESVSESVERDVGQGAEAVPAGPDVVVCEFCGRRCRPFARLEPLRVRRRDRLRLASTQA